MLLFQTMFVCHNFNDTGMTRTCWELYDAVRKYRNESGLAKNAEIKSNFRENAEFLTIGLALLRNRGKIRKSGF